MGLLYGSSWVCCGGQVWGTHAYSKVSCPLSFRMHFVKEKFLGHSFSMGLSRSVEEKVGALLSVE